jgi:very-short-patch-repair endonuclease
MSSTLPKAQLNTFAKKLRTSSTPAELALWSKIRNRQLIGLKFRRQVPIGPYIVDFICYEKRLILEIDGGQHADSSKDQIRDAWLVSQGFQVLRFWDVDVLQNMSGTLEAIWQSATRPLTSILSRFTPTAASGPGERR